MTQDDQIEAMLRDGIAPADVAGALGLHVKIVRRVANRAGLTSWTWKAALESQLVAEYAAGAPSTDVAEKYGCSTNKVLAAVRRAGVDVRPTPHPAAGAPLSDAGRDALSMVRDGSSYAEAARAVGLTRERVRQIAGRYRRDGLAS